MEYLIILDDGGSLICNLATYKLPDTVKVAGVEQTIFGTRDPRLKIFHVSLRPSCNKCYQKNYRISDYCKIRNNSNK